MSGLKLSDERRAELVSNLQSFFSDEFDEDLSSFRADELVNFVLQQIGPAAYNAGIQDARAFIAAKLDDLDIEFTQPDSPV